MFLDELSHFLLCRKTRQTPLVSLRDGAQSLQTVLQRYGRIDILINNAANNPKVEQPSSLEQSRMENFPLERWQDDLAVGLTGAFLCSQVLGAEMARRKRGVIVNIASDLAVIAPDQRLYRQEGRAAEQQPDAFVQKLSALIPLARMAHADEYQGALLFLCSDASSYMTGTNLVVDGGRSCW